MSGLGDAREDRGWSLTSTYAGGRTNPMARLCPCSDDSSGNGGVGGDPCMDCQTSCYDPSHVHWQANSAWMDDSPGANEFHSDWGWSIPPSLSLDTSISTHAAMVGSTGFLVFDVGSCQRTTQMRIRNDGDQADIRLATFSASSGAGGPWTTLATLDIPVNTNWLESPMFDTTSRYLKLQWSANHGYASGTRIVDVQLAASNSCADAPPAYALDRVTTGRLRILHRPASHPEVLADTS